MISPAITAFICHSLMSERQHRIVGFALYLARVFTWLGRHRSLACCSRGSKTIDALQQLTQTQTANKSPHSLLPDCVEQF